ncbi:AAA family ATPase [Shewanella benthica]|uniref:anti-phage protein Ppl n=1 Tax=Shewanella benthica TaxID=43661 RepID=UPI001879D50E|nr:anti-phage protein Ppl [Shewanella benthica]MBE7215952.1 AAA family ATPase [Shewanella benthica]MCL1063644.1 AAA family ATPase [Shewanella benthica]
MVYGTDWFKFDFHCHSPASDDYREEGVSSRDWLLGYMEANIDAVILSDHNTGAFVDRVKEALGEMRVEFESGEMNGYRPLSIFPSVELTATGNVHVLGVFSEEFSSEQIAGVVGACGKPLNSKNHVLVLSSGVEQCIEIIKKHDGLAVLAHIDRPKGLLATEKNLEAIRQIFSKPIDAIELKGSLSDLDRQKSKFIENMPLVIGSDSHERCSSGRQFTWIKMSEINFSGLKTALADHEYSVIRSVDGIPPSQPINRVNEIRIKTNTCSMNGAPVTVGFSPWYSSIIGSRGSGKSTVVEYIRYALGIDSELPKDIKVKYDKFVKNTVGLDSTIELDYYKDSQKYLIKSSPLLNVVEYEDSDGVVVSEEFSPQRFPISIYSQKMLFEIANASNAFLQIVDKSKEVDFDNWYLEHQGIVDQYGILFSQKERLTSQNKQLNILRNNYKDVTLSIDQVQDSNYSRLVADKEQIEKEKNYLNQFVIDLEARLHNVELECDEQFKDFVEPDYELDSVGLEWVENVTQLRIDFVSSVQSLVEDFRTKVEEATDSLPYSDNSNSMKKNSEELQGCIALLNEKGTSPERLIELVKEKSALAEKIRELSSSPEKLVSMNELLEQKYQEMLKSRQYLTKRRQCFIDSLDIKNLKIKVLPLGEPGEDLIENYKQVVGFESFSEHILDLDSKGGLLGSFVKTERRNPKTELNAYSELEKVKALHTASVEKLKEVGMHGSFAKKLSELTSDRIESLNSWFPEDGIFIQFKRDDESWSNLEDASPGQQSASMLSFLLSYGDEPIIIDQPEDDLDCAMLSTNVIPNIRKNKSRRQLILVTHSAPLVVNGDAENVISMKFDKGQVTVGKMGSIQEPDMKDLICTQMEGGKDAFKSRYSRLTS